MVIIVFADENFVCDEQNDGFTLLNGLQLHFEPEQKQSGFQLLCCLSEEKQNERGETVSLLEVMHFLPCSLEVWVQI